MACRGLDLDRDAAGPLIEPGHGWPIEIEEERSVLTHGVAMVRGQAKGAVLPGRNNPTQS